MKRLITVILLALGILISGVGDSPAAEKELLGAGATFPYPLYSKMFDVYHKISGVKVNYQAIGSGGGVRQIKNKTVDFGASDAFLNDKTMREFPAQVLHVPSCAGAVVVTYNLPGNPVLKITPGVISGIFLGKIKKWDDPRIAELNPDTNLPDIGIIVVHRSDGSGTTFIFSDYLTKVSLEWKSNVGCGKSLNWPVGLGAKGNPGVAGLVKQIPGSIGYVELIYSVQNNMPAAKIRNKAGNFIEPSLETVSLAANTELPDDMRVSLTDTDSSYGYPISGFTWIIVYKNLKDGGLTYGKAQDLVKLLWWIVHQGQRYAEPLHYAPLSDKARKKAERIIKSITYKGEYLFNEQR